MQEKTEKRQERGKMCERKEKGICFGLKSFKLKVLGAGTFLNGFAM